MYDPQIGRWMTPDPLVGKYVDWSPYNYVYNNPIKNIDPDGREIWLYYEEAKRKNGEIQYKRKGEAKTVTRSVQYKDGKLLDRKANEYAGDNKFLNGTKAALDYIQKNGADINAFDNKRTVKELSDSEKKVSIREGGDYVSGSIYDKRSITFDPNGAKELLNEKGEIVGRQSAALELLHEMGHAYMDIFYGVVAPAMLRVTNIEGLNEVRDQRLLIENSIIPQFENPAARKLGETPRKNYEQKANYYAPVSTTSTEKQKQ